MTYPYRRRRFAQAPAVAGVWWALLSMLFSVNIAHGAPNASLEPIDFSGRASRASATSPASPANPSTISRAHEFAKHRAELAVANTADSTTAAIPIPAPTEYMLLAGGLLILWGSLRWKNRTRRPVNAPRSRLKKR